MILLVDNYDSFSYNLYHLIGNFSSDICVLRNDDREIYRVLEEKPEAVFLSPGPGKPADAGFCLDLIKKAAGKIPLFGVCLGHQAICEAFGGTVINAPQIMHGKKDIVAVDTENPLFRDLPREIAVARYHSLIARKQDLPSCLEVSAESRGGEIMAVKHREYPVFGVQFHPESIMTDCGGKIMENFFQHIG